MRTRPNRQPRTRTLAALACAVAALLVSALLLLPAQVPTSSDDDGVALTRQRGTARVSTAHRTPSAADQPQSDARAASMSRGAASMPAAPSSDASLSPGTSALAATDTPRSRAATLQVSSGSLGTPGSVAATTTDCSTVTVSWTAATNADTYYVQKRIDGGDWLSLEPDTGNVVSIDDTTGYTNVTVSYRVTALRTGTRWYGPPSLTSSIEC